MPAEQDPFARMAGALLPRKRHELIRETRPLDCLVAANLRAQKGRDENKGGEVLMVGGDRGNVRAYMSFP